MRLAVGFIFTEFPIHFLEKKGFVFQSQDFTDTKGYRSFLCYLTPSADDLCGFELREILDETLYAATHPDQKHEPYVTTLDSDTKGNGPFRMEQVVFQNDLKDTAAAEYLKPRKNFPLWALWIKGKVPEPDFQFEWKKQKFDLIHLGPNCFDLIFSS